MQKRNIVTCVILSIVTLGIYGLYWIAKINDDIKTLAKDEKMPSGGMVVLLSIITCGIYSFYWVYQMGQLIYKAQKDRKVEDAKDNSILYLILEVVFAILNPILMQNEINKMID